MELNETSLEIAASNVEDYSDLTASLESKNLEIESMRMEIVSLKESAALSNEDELKVDSTELTSQLELKVAEYGQLLEANNAYVQAYNNWLGGK